jgi:hypothetical protein
MEAKGIFKKTELGRAEVEGRQMELSQHERRILILVNGDKDVDALSRLSLCENSGEILIALLEKGLVEPVETAQTAASASSAGAADAQPAPEMGAREFLVNTLNTMANRVRVKGLVQEIGSVEDIDGLKELINSWYQAISDTPAGMYQADNLKKQLQELIAWEEVHGLR